MDKSTALTATAASRRQARQHRHDALATEIVCALRRKRLAADEKHADELGGLFQELPPNR